jgi:hypothetical protein
VTGASLLEWTSIPNIAHTEDMVKSLLCRVGWHKWQRRVTDDGGRYLVCARCGKEGEASPLLGGGPASL